ncbi:MAG: transglutaminase domain-containing protein [Syntrophomonadaceae bacterium]|nr:transglutaminase domain-containing protein [Syntrophomonadaceae bacterium]
MSSGKQPLTGSNPYIPLCALTEAEDEAFLGSVADNSTRNQKFIDWLYANTDALVGYILAYYGDSYSTMYGFIGIGGSNGFFETDAIKAHFSKLIGNSNRETAVNVINGVDEMIVYGSGHIGSTSVGTLSEPRPYVLDCYGSSEFMIAALKAAGIPALYVEGYCDSDSHAWVVCYLSDERTWEFIAATVASKDHPFIQRDILDASYKTEGIAFPCGIAGSDDSWLLLSASYYLNYAYPDKVVIPTT